MATIGNTPAVQGTQVLASSFNGDGTTTAFTLSATVSNTYDIEVLVDNVQQSPYDGSYSVSGTTLTFSEAPIAGENNIYVIHRGVSLQTAQIVPDDGSVTTNKILDGSITTDKLVNGSVTSAKLSSTYLEAPGGVIRSPNQPFFYAKNASESGDGITTNPAVFTNVIVNVGGHFVTSGTGAYSRFIAPVDGVYFFSGNPGYKQTNLDFAVRLRINGVDTTDVIRIIGGNSSHTGYSFSSIIYLTSGDYVDLNMAGAGSIAYHRNNSSVPNWFSGGLLY